MKSPAALGSSARWLASTLVVGLGLGLSTPAAAAIIWKADFETGDLSQFSSLTNATKGARKNIEVVTEGAQQGKNAGKVTIHPDDTFSSTQMRVQMNRSNPRTGEGQNLYMSFHVKMTTAPLARDNIAYFETNSSYRNVMTWWIAPGAAGGPPTINYGTGNLGPNNQWSSEFTLNQWHQVAFHVFWTTNAANGTIKVWYDGKLVRDLKLATKPDGNSLFFQAGIHRAQRSDAVDTIFFDNFIEADSLADLMIAEGPPASDAGAGPADAGATDTAAPGSGGRSGGNAPTPEVGYGCAMAPGGSTGAGAPLASLALTASLLGLLVPWRRRRRARSRASRAE
ncbi:MAG TPA: heparin lyase I family protein [Polyangia bacterium]